MRGVVMCCAAAVLAACGGDVSIGLGLDQPIRLNVGQTALLRDEDLSLRFVRVVSDNRCPSDVTCVVAGEATIVVEVRRAPAAPAQLSLTVPMPDTATYGNYDVRLVELDPYPVSTVTPDFATYRATLVASER